MTEVVVEYADVAADDGVHLAVTVYRPAGGPPQPCLVEALPYRQHDVTAAYASTYRHFAGAGGYAVCRVDVRGTGCSGGIATDEYPDVERADLRAVFRWLAAQPWCTGRVGMFGTSYSGFNALQMAADAPPELGAVVATYSSDDRFTDDVHFHGGALRAIDLVDYVLYMVPMNALPPTPARWGDGWVAEWKRRVELTPPWVLGWLRDQVDGPAWRRGSLRLGPGGAGYERVTVPVMLVAGWADGYRNNTFRTVERLRVPWRLLVGPWGHQDPATARPGPNVDVDAEMLAWFDRHLRGPSGGEGPRPPRNGEVHLFTRGSTRPEPDLAVVDGEWASVSGAPRFVVRTVRPAGGPGVDEIHVRGDAGTAAWISCAGGLPWGQPLDQRTDDERSLRYDMACAEPVTVTGTVVVRARVRSSAPVAYLAVKLCDVFPDGTSSLVTRGLLNLAHLGAWPADPSGAADRPPAALDPGRWYDVSVELEATSAVVAAGHRLRLVLAGADWPNVWPPPSAAVLSVDRASIEIDLPRIDPATIGPAPRLGAGPGPGPVDLDGTQWKIEHDVLRRTTVARTAYGGTYGGDFGAVVTDRYEGEVGVSTVDPAHAWAGGRASFRIAWPEGECHTWATLSVRSDAATYVVDLRLEAELDGETLAARHWHEVVPRHLQ